MQEVDNWPKFHSRMQHHCLKKKQNSFFFFFKQGKTLLEEANSFGDFPLRVFHMGVLSAQLWLLRFSSLK